MMDYCVGCTTEMLPHLDDDPNGASNATCARCRAEEAHDFDLEPNVEFERSGREKEKPVKWEEKMDVTVLMIVNDKVISRTTCDENLAEVLCVSLKDKSRIVTDYIVVSRDDDILWIVDGMTPGWIIPESTEDVLNRYPELKGKF